MVIKKLLGLLLSTAAFASYYSTPGGGGVSIGGTVSGGLNNYVLFVHPDGTLAQSSSFQFNDTTKYLTLDGTTLFTTATNPGSGAGVAANPGSLAFYNSGGVGTLYAKYGASDTSWINVLTGASGWSLLGNSGTTAGTNFLGTTDNVDVVLKANNTERLRVGASGTVAITGNQTVSSDLTISSLTGGKALYSNGSKVISESSTTDTQLGYLASATAALASTSTTGLLSSTDWNTFNGKLTSPLTTKGDILGYSTTNARIPIGTDGQVLTADSAQTLGLKWATPTTGTVTSVDLTMPGIFSVTGNPITSSGTLAVTASGTSGGIPYFSGSTTLASSAALAANQLVLGGGAGTAPSTLGSLGTTTTVLHGNAAGAPTFGAIVNSDITNGTIDLTTKVTGALPIANGGTNNASLSVSAGSVYYGDGTKLVALAPGTSGYLLQSNGTSAPSWVAVASATPTIFGSRGTPRSIVAATGITSGASHMSTTAAIQDIYVEGSAAGDNVCATITAGTIDGQRMTIIGRNDSNTLTFNSTTTNVVVNGSWTGGANDIITFRWDTSAWVEIDRNN